ncbi:MAG: alpha/beta hydrolase [Pseudomonadota bacterium]
MQKLSSTIELMRIYGRAGLKNTILQMMLLIAMMASASAFELKPFKDRLFAYPKTLQSADGGDYRVVDYQELRDINDRDDVPEKRVNRRYVDFSGRRATKQASVQTSSGSANYYFAGKTKSPSIVTVYIHGSGGNGKQGINDFSFGGNFNRIKMLMLKNNGLYLSPDANAFGPDSEQKISAIIKTYVGDGAGRRIVLACGSAGGDICHRLADNSDIAPLIAGVVFLGSYWSDAYVASKAVRAGVPTFIGHGSNDVVFPIANMENFYQRLRQTGSPVQLVRFETGTHGTPIRMIDWRQTINWILSN